MLNVELYYLENLEIDTILRCKNEACDCALILLDYKGAILHSFKYDNYIAEDISFDKFDYEDNEPLKINILFKCSDK